MLEWLVGFCQCSGTREATLEYPEVFHFLIFLGQLASLDIFQTFGVTPTGKTTAKASTNMTMCAGEAFPLDGFHRIIFNFPYQVGNRGFTLDISLRWLVVSRCFENVKNLHVFVRSHCPNKLSFRKRTQPWDAGMPSFSSLFKRSIIYKFEDFQGLMSPLPQVNQVSSSSLYSLRCREASKIFVDFWERSWTAEKLGRKGWSS